MPPDTLDTGLNPSAGRKPQTPSALDDYLKLQLGPASPTAAELLNGVDEEYARDGRLTISDDFSTVPPGMTPRMMSWWKAPKVEVPPAEGAWDPRALEAEAERLRRGDAPPSRKGRRRVRRY